MTADSTPAFKEWQSVVAALESGRQSIILRKGGIAEGPAGFQLDAERFWLFPTFFHAQAEKLREVPAPAPEPPHGKVRLSSFAEVVRAEFVEEWDRVRALAPFHIWNEEVIRDRFDWAVPAGIFCILVRVHLTAPVELEITSEMQGCKSWVQVPVPFPTTSKPALADDIFAEFRRTILL